MDKIESKIIPITATYPYQCRVCFSKVLAGQKVCSKCGFGILWDETLPELQSSSSRHREEQI